MHQTHSREPESNLTYPVSVGETESVKTSSNHSRASSHTQALESPKGGCFHSLLFVLWGACHPEPKQIIILSYGCPVNFS